MEATSAADFIEARAKRVRAAPARAEAKSVIRRTAKLSKWSGKGNPYARTKTGYRADLGINVRSGWEANLLRVLKAFDIAYEFEPKIFTFPIKRGNKAYTPDVYLKKSDEWIEVKGYLDPNSKIKLKRFKKYYPKDFARLTMVISKSSKEAREFCAEIGVPTVVYYEDLSRTYKSSLPTWEGR